MRQTERRSIEMNRAVAAGSRITRLPTAPKNVRTVAALKRAAGRWRMSDVPRDEFEALKERVAELESQLEGATAATAADGLDHRDETVLSYMRENGRRSGYKLVKLYTSLTDIQDKGKAKRRAKTLAQHDAYEDL